MHIFFCFDAASLDDSFEIEKHPDKSKDGRK